MSEGVQTAVILWNLGKWAGVIGFTCLSFLIFTGDTARFFDRYFGLDRIIKFQRKFSLFTAFFVTLHPIFFMLSAKSVINFLIPDFSVMPFALGVMAFYILVIIMIASRLYKRISYTIWQYLHILTYVLFFFGLFHAVNLGSDSNLIYIKTLYGLLFSLVFVGIIYRSQYKIRKRYSSKFQVKEIKQETADTFTLVLTPEKKFKFKAGQFCFLRINKGKLHSRHPFTISSSPQETDLGFTIKKAGRFTQIASELVKGEEVIIDGPFGNFVDRDEKKDLVFIAGGVGITPFMSLIKDHVSKNKTQNIFLLYGSKTEKDIIFKKKLDSISGNWFKKVFVLSQEEVSPVICERGRINKDIIEKYTKNISNALFYICGPEALKNCAEEALIGLGVKRKNIIIEDFFW